MISFKYCLLACKAFSNMLPLTFNIFVIKSGPYNMRYTDILLEAFVNMRSLNISLACNASLCSPHLVEQAMYSLG